MHNNLPTVPPVTQNSIRTQPNSTSATSGASTQATHRTALSNRKPSYTNGGIGSQSVAARGGVSAGVVMFMYYRYNGNYYKLIGATSAIQNNIEKCLCDNFYQIKGIDPSKEIAMFRNGYYQELDYLFPDTVYYNNKPYLMNLNSIEESVGSQIGSYNDFNLYSVKGVYSLKQIYVSYLNNYHIAYQAPSSVNFNGKTYVTNLFEIYSISQVALQAKIGQSQGFDLYKVGSDSPGPASDNFIAVKINNTQVAYADAIVLPTEGLALPTSKSDDPYYVSCEDNIQYKGHGIYGILSNYDSQTVQDKFKAEVGDLLQSYSINGIPFNIYQIKGKDPAKAVLLRCADLNGGIMYKEYEFVYPDTVVYNGATYQMDYTKDDVINGIRVIRGGAIGQAGGKYEVDSINNIDPSVAIIVVMSGNNPYGYESSTCTFYRVNN